MKPILVVLVVVMLFAVASEAMAKDLTVVAENVWGRVIVTVPDPGNEAPDGVLVPFSHLANYMSLPGLVRWLIYVREHRWLPTEGLRVVSVS